MSAIKHTPGPWTVAMHGSFETVIRAASGRRVAATWVQGPAKSREGALNQGRVNEANAHLIAAAPDLLEALKWFIDDIDGTHTRMLDFDANVERSRKAIAKAEGRA